MAINIKEITTRMQHIKEEEDEQKQKAMIQEFQDNQQWKDLVQQVSVWFEALSDGFRKLAKSIQPVLIDWDRVYINHINGQKKASYKKKKSQRKNWSKWKKRR